MPKEALRYLYGVYKVFAVQEKKLHETEVKLGQSRGRRGGDRGRTQGRRPVAVPIEGEDLRDGAPVVAAQ